MRGFGPGAFLGVEVRPAIGQPLADDTLDRVVGALLVVGDYVFDKPLAAKRCHKHEKTDTKATAAQ